MLATGMCISEWSFRLLFYSTVLHKGKGGIYIYIQTISNKFVAPAFCYKVFAYDYRQFPQWTDNPLRAKWLENNDRRTWENLCTLWKQIY